MSVLTRVLQWWGRHSLKGFSALERKILDELLRGSDAGLRPALERQVAAVRGVRRIASGEEVFFWFDTEAYKTDALRLTPRQGELKFAEFDIKYHSFGFRSEIRVVDGFMYGIEYAPAPIPIEEPQRLSVTLTRLELRGAE